jgi:ubiquinone/menaquinone biosynthesis C-methylase UbiE
MPSVTAREYFEIIAEAGLTKHGGSVQATRELIELCHIKEGKYVLDVGCGVGATPSYLAKTLGCRVVGVDLLEKMIEQSRQRAKSDGVQDRTEFRVSDARELPFEEDLFDAVISESVYIFFDDQDKTQAIREYVRVTKPGGFVGITEGTWLNPPTPEMIDTMQNMVSGKLLDAQGWEDLLRVGGLIDVVGKIHPIDLSAEAKGRFERYGFWRVLRTLPKVLRMTLFDKKTRQVMKSAAGAVSGDLMNEMGYGVFAGRKGQRPSSKA